MSLFFSRVSKLTARRENSRFFSSLPQFPCLLLPFETLRESPEGKFVYHKILDASEEKIVRSKEKKVPKELHGQTFIGVSQGWVVSMNTKDRSLHLSDLYKPWVSSPIEVISLPSLGGLMPSTNAATKVSLSSSDPVHDKDLFVVAKFNNHWLSVCKPSSDSKWTHIKAPISPSSELMYSKRDKAFYFTSSSKDLYLGSLDISNDNELKFYDLRLRNEPTIPKDGMLDECIMSKHLVESPSGELFLIKWYKKCIKRDEWETKRFMVFREDEKTKEFCYTEDIGDLCIFLGKSEPFCLLARMYPGLKPNSIYYIGRGVGSYDLAFDTICHFHPIDHPWLVKALYWLHPNDRVHAKGTEKGTDEGITFPAEEVVGKRQEHFLGKEHQELFLENEVHEKITTTKFSSQGLEEEEIVEKPQELFLEKPQELFLEKPQELFLEKPKELFLEKPKELFLEKPQELFLEKPQELFLEKPQELFLEKPQELFLEKQVVEKPQELFLEKEVHEKVTTKKFSNQGFEKEEVHSKTTTKKFNNQGREEEEVHSKILTRKFSSQGLEEEEVVERTTRKFR